LTGGGVAVLAATVGEPPVAVLNAINYYPALELPNGVTGVLTPSGVTWDFPSAEPLYLYLACTSNCPTAGSVTPNLGFNFSPLPGQTAAAVSGVAVLYVAPCSGSGCPNPSMASPTGYSNNAIVLGNGMNATWSNGLASVHTGQQPNGTLIIYMKCPVANVNC
jgi:hypothetical protein